MKNDDQIYDREEQVYNILISLFYIAVGIGGILAIYLASQNIFLGLAMAGALTVFAIRANEALYEYYKARVELIAFSRQVRDLYIYTKDLDGEGHDGTEVARKDYALEMLQKSNNKNNVRVHLLLKGDVLIRVYSLKDGAVQEERKYRDVDTLPATERYSEFAYFIEDYIKRNETERVNRERRGGQHLDQWLDKYMFDQQSNN